MKSSAIETMIATLLSDPDWTLHVSDRALWAVGSIVASSDFAVMHYADPWHRKFFGKRSALVHAVRRGFEPQLWHGSRRERLLNQIERMVTDPVWHANAAEDDWIPAIRDGCQQLRSCLARWSGEQMANHLMSITFRMVDADRQALLETFGFVEHTTQIVDNAADGCALFYTEFWPPLDWDTRRTQVSLRAVCALGDVFRTWLAWKEPTEPRGDWERLISSGLTQLTYEI